MPKRRKRKPYDKHLKLEWEIKEAMITAKAKGVPAEPSYGKQHSPKQPRLAEKLDEAFFAGRAEGLKSMYEAVTEARAEKLKLQKQLQEHTQELARLKRLIDLALDKLDRDRG